MGASTPIQWCDSTLNLQMGCDGCELWNGKKKVCYSGRMIDGDGRRPGFGGRKGYPPSFSEPTLFLHRLPEALRWKDLTGTERADKPWLNGLPRIVFLNDMGDTFSKDLPLDWLAPLLPDLAASPHQFLVLTKRPSRFVEFSIAHPLPENIWPGTSVTSMEVLRRIDQIAEVRGGGPKFVSVEPMWSAIDFTAAQKRAALSWLIFGGESGPDATPCNIGWIRSGKAQAQEFGAKVFVKQLGARPYWENPGARSEFDVGGGMLDLKDSHGGDMSEWPEDLRVREFPKAKE